MKENPDFLNAELKATLDDIKANLSIITKDGSNGVHNLNYALAIMALAKRHLAEMPLPTASGGVSSEIPP